MDVELALDVARTVVREAAELLANAADNVGEIRTKSTSRDFVTEWDTRSETLIRNRLAELSPGIPILAEESGATGGPAQDYLWLIDPLDGTVNFTHGVPMWGITVALEHRGESVAGVVRAPALGWEFYAGAGMGAYMGQHKLRVSNVSRLDRAMLVTGFPYDSPTTRHNFAEWEHFQCTAGACRRFGAAALDLCMVARGWLDGFWESRLNPWDLSAGALMVREAGGTVSNYQGGLFQSADGSAVATNGAIHEQVLRELAAVSSRGSS